MSMGILSVLGLAVFGGLLGAWLFQKIRFPQVVGYIIIGLVIGASGFKIVNTADVAELKSLNLFALGLIGFLVGGELKLTTFRKYAKQFLSILLFEGLTAFVLVAVAVYFIILMFTGNVTAAIAGGIFFGAIASATDPASTLDVIWEYRAAGVVTAATVAIVALDDALALTLYGIGAGISQLLVTDADHTHSLMYAAVTILGQLVGSLGLGAVFALVLIGFLRSMPMVERAVALSVGTVLLAIGIATFFKFDVILTTMMLGFVLVNVTPRRSEGVFKLMRNLAIPVYVMFFVLVGARLEVGKVPLWLWGIVILYIVCRGIGKMAGCYLGSKLTFCPETVRKYLGLGLFSQGGVAIGLAIVAGEYLQQIKITDDLNLGDMVVYTVTATTLILQIIGPALVKVSLKLAQELGRNVTEEDLMSKLRISDLFDNQVKPICETDSLELAVQYFTDHDVSIIPVVDNKGCIKGLLSFDNLKEVLAERDTWSWLLVADVIRPFRCEYVTPDQSVLEAYQKLEQLNLDQLPILDNQTHTKPLGIVDRRLIRQKIQGRMLSFQKPVSEM